VIVSEAHGLTHDGNRYFGMLQVVNGHGHEDYSMVVGVRNSHDRTFPAALALGSGVFVCDNLAFRGEVKLARKHTRFIDRDLPLLVNRAVGLLGAHRQGLDLQIAAYKQQEVAEYKSVLDGTATGSVTSEVARLIVQLPPSIASCMRVLVILKTRKQLPSPARSFRVGEGWVRENSSACADQEDFPHPDPLPR
jgi:hypothetical protein